MHFLFVSSAPEGRRDGASRQNLCRQAGNRQTLNSYFGQYDSNSDNKTQIGQYDSNFENSTQIRTTLLLKFRTIRLKLGQYNSNPDNATQICRRYDSDSDNTTQICSTGHKILTEDYKFR